MFHLANARPGVEGGEGKGPLAQGSNCGVWMRAPHLLRLGSRGKVWAQHLDGAVSWAVWAIDRRLVTLEQLQAPPPRTGASSGGQPLVAAVRHFLELLLPDDGSPDGGGGGAVTQVHCICAIHTLVTAVLQPPMMLNDLPGSLLSLLYSTFQCRPLRHPWSGG